MTFRTSLVFITVTFATVIGCTRSPSVEKAPLPKSKQKELKNVVTGTWKLTHRKRWERSELEPVKDGTIKKWTLRRDGSIVTETIRGHWFTDPTPHRTTGTWRLQGRNLKLEKSDSIEVRFRVEDWSENQMTWYNYDSGSYYVLERIQ